MQALIRVGVFLPMIAAFLLVFIKPDLSQGVEAGKPMTTSERIKAARLKIPVDPRDIVGSVKEIINKQFTGTPNEARVERVQKDNIGLTHIRMKQYYRGIPIDGSDIIVHVNKNNTLYDIDGSMIQDFSANISHRLDGNRAAEVALQDAQNSKCLDGQCQQWRKATAYDGFKSGDLTSCATPELIIAGNRLVYEAKIRERTDDEADWIYWIDASTGEVLEKYNLINHLSYPPSNQGYDTLVKGIKMADEIQPGTDSVVTITGWRDTGSTTRKNYYLYSKGIPDSIGPWGIYNCHYLSSWSDSLTDSLIRWEQKSMSDWGTNDRYAISLAKDMALTQKWITDSLGMNSYDDAGRLLISRIHTKSSNAPGFIPLDTTILWKDSSAGTPNHNWGSLDELAHEVGHAITFFSSHLSEGTGKEQAALNESFSDIMGTSVEFIYQPDSSQKYPGALRGTADWLIGEDNFIGTGKLALRDMRYPQRQKQNRDTLSSLEYATYYDGTFFWDDSTGQPYPLLAYLYYKQSGVQSFAFYLLAEGNPDSIRHNDGNLYSVFNGIGRAAAAQVALRANIYHLNKYSSYLDSKIAWLKTAQELVDAGKISNNSVAVVESAWVSVGVKPELRVHYQDQTRMQIGGNKGDLKVHNYYSNSSLSGLKFKSTLSGTAKGISCTAGANYFYSSGGYDSLANTFLDSQDSLSKVKALVFRGPDGKADLCVDTLGNIKVRKRVRYPSF
jgi:Zn-dependent metalloprotease